MTDTNGFNIPNNDNREVNVARSAMHDYSGFTSCSTQLEVSDKKIIVRMLRMDGASMIFVGLQGRESMDELGIAVPPLPGSKMVSGTTLLGSEYCSNSQRLAELWTKRYGHQFIVCSNVATDGIDGVLLERAINDWVRAQEMMKTSK